MTHKLTPEERDDLSERLVDFLAGDDNYSRAIDMLAEHWPVQLNPRQARRNRQIIKFARAAREWRHWTGRYCMLMREYQKAWREACQRADEIQDAFSKFACSVMVESVIGMADAAVVVNKQYDARDSLAAVQQLAREHKSLRVAASESDRAYQGEIAELRVALKTIKRELGQCKDDGATHQHVVMAYMVADTALGRSEPPALADRQGLGRNGAQAHWTPETGGEDHGN